MPMSNSREFVVKVGHVLLLSLLLMLLLVPQRQAQNLPHPRNNKVPETDMGTFQNSHIVIPGRERDFYLFKESPRNLTFSQSRNGSILITVTPCASSISWYLYRKPIRIQESGWIGQQQRGQRTTETLAHFTGDSRETFVQLSAPAGVYLIDITSLDSDSHVKIFVTTDPEVRGSIYPLVPPSHQVNAQAVKRTLVLDWPSGSAVNRLKRSVEYCITISRIRNFHSHCGALAYLRGDKKPKLPSWGFKGERERNRKLLRSANPVKRQPSKMIFHQCVANKTSFTHTKVRRGKTYFVDVFIVDKDTNTASSYAGTTVTIKKRKRSPKTKMKVGETKTINLKRKRMVEVKLETSISRLAFEVIPCTEKVPFELYHNGKKIRRKTTARHWKRHFIRNAAPGTYLMTFPGKKKKKKTFVTVLITSTPSRSKVIMPKNKRIFVFDKVTTCTNVTIAWKTAHVDQKYCLLKKKLKRNGRGSKRRKCLSPEERSKTDQETCIQYKATGSMSDVQSYKVTGLQPATLYRFDVFASRARSASVPYKSVKVKTLENCTVS